MALTRESGEASLIDVLERILDKGMVTDAWVRVSLVVIDLLTKSLSFQLPRHLLPRTASYSFFRGEPSRRRHRGRGNGIWISPALSA